MCCFPIMWVKSIVLYFNLFSPDQRVSQMHIISGFNLYINCSLIIALLEVHPLTLHDIRHRVSLLEGWVLS